jgi:hypothetical protein
VGKLRASVADIDDAVTAAMMLESMMTEDTYTISGEFLSKRNDLVKLYILISQF